MAPPRTRFLPITTKPRRGAYFLVYLDLSGKWRWRFQSANGQILADSGESFPSRDNALRSIRNLTRLIPISPTLAEG